MDDIQPQGEFHRGAGHERTDAKIRGILIFAVILAVSTAIIQIGLGLWAEAFSRNEERALAAQPKRFRNASGQFPTPRLQGDPGGDMAKLRAEEDKRLQSYGWVDRQQGVAHIPIDRAIDALARKGLPTRESKPAGAP